MGNHAGSAELINHGYHCPSSYAWYEVSSTLRHPVFSPSLVRSLIRHDSAWKTGISEYEEQMPVFEL